MTFHLTQRKIETFKKNGNPVNAFTKLYSFIETLSKEEQLQIYHSYAPLFLPLLFYALHGVIPKKKSNQLEYLCSLEQTPQIRKKGFFILLLFLNHLDQFIDDNHRSILARAINLDPFLVDYPTNSVQLLHEPLSSKLENVPKSRLDKSPNTKKEKIELFNIFFQFITKLKNKQKPILINTFFRCFLPTCYPKVAKNIKLIDQNSEFGFKTHCPIILQSIFIENILEWINEEKICKWLFSTEFRVKILLGIFEQAILLPLAESKTILSIIDLYSSWITTNHCPELILNQFQFYIKEINTQLIERLKKLPNNENENFGLIKMTRIILEFIESLCLQQKYYLSKNNFHYLIEELIKVLTIILNSNQVKYINSVSEYYFGRLLNIWIHSRSTSRYYSNLIKNLFEKYKNNCSCVIQWKNTLIKFTIMIHNCLINVQAPFLNERISKSLLRGKGQPLILELDFFPNINKMDKNFLPVIGPPSELETKIHSIGLFESILPFDFTIARFYWSKMLKMFGNIDNIKDDKLYQIILGTYLEVSDLIDKFVKYYCENEDMTDLTNNNINKDNNSNSNNSNSNNNDDDNNIHKNNKSKVHNNKIQMKNEKINQNNKKNNPILINEISLPPRKELFYPIFSKACFDKKKIHRGGYPIAFAGICHLLCQPSSYNLSDQELANYYYLISYGLSLKSEEIDKNILRYCQTLFSYSFRGSMGLLNSFLDRLNDYCSNEKINRIYKISYLDIIYGFSSILNLQEQYQNLEIYKYESFININNQNIELFIDFQNNVLNEIERRESILKIINEPNFVVNEKNLNELQMINKKESNKWINLIKEDTNFQRFNGISTLNNNIREQIINNLIILLSINKKNLLYTDFAKIQTLWVLYSTTLIELNLPKNEINIDLLKKCIQMFYNHSFTKDESINETIYYIFNSLSKYSLLIYSLDDSIIIEYILSQCTEINKILKNTDPLIEFEHLKNDKDLKPVPVSISYSLLTMINFIISIPSLLEIEDLQILFFTTLFKCFGLDKTEDEIVQSMDFANYLLSSSMALQKRSFNSKIITNGTDSNKSTKSNKGLKSPKSSRSPKLSKSPLSGRSPKLSNTPSSGRSPKMSPISPKSAKMKRKSWSLKNFSSTLNLISTKSTEKKTQEKIQYINNDNTDLLEQLLQKIVIETHKLHHQNNKDQKKNDTIDQKKIKNKNKNKNKHNNDNEDNENDINKGLESLVKDSSSSSSPPQIYPYHRDYDLLKASQIVLTNLLIYWKNITAIKNNYNINNIFLENSLSFLNNKHFNDNLQDYIFIALIDGTIISLKEIYAEKNIKIQFIVRDLTGKWDWEIKKFIINNEDEFKENKSINKNTSEEFPLNEHESQLLEQKLEPNYTDNKFDIMDEKKSNNIYINNKNIREREREREINTNNNEDEDLLEILNFMNQPMDKSNRIGNEKDNDKKIELFEQITQNYIQQNNEIINIINKKSNNFENEINHYNNNSMKFYEDNNNNKNNNNNNNNNNKNNNNNNNNNNKIKKHKKFNEIQLLLIQLGFLDPKLNSNDLIILNKNHELIEELNTLDQIPSFIFQKISIIYIKNNQTNSIQILSNQKGSTLFEQFISKLGYKSKSNDKKNENVDNIYRNSIFYSNFQNQIMFQISTRLWKDNKIENINNNLKILQNNQVQIIWSENYEKSDFETLKIFYSGKNMVQIIIYPLPNYLFKIQIRSKINVKSFGPLRNGMCVDLKFLIPLLRETAIITDRLIKKQKKKSINPHLDRKKLISQIISKFKLSVPFVQYIQQLNNENNDKQLTEEKEVRIRIENQN
ncbi:rho gtpase-activating protein [Anaeramoeba flamelloides]|uniref:Rho gtpase-activating protein n=1 Tax=Anaeramoeba flamelloides TaxID=1746091 RepID=A0ABQ8YRT8_9EUKA|nr:rho gtpase-activating protein [Anaeramoeba flamelloides]